LIQRARLALGITDRPELILYARRCLYRRRQGTLLVTEVFLPSVLELVLQDKKQNKAQNKEHQEAQNNATTTITNRS
jgi:hypothetical protein